MDRWKQGMKVIMMFMVLFGIVFAPFLYTEFQNRRMINQFVLSPIETIKSDEEREIKQEYNIWERIECVNQATKVSSSVVKVSYYENEDTINPTIEEVITTMEMQIALLCEYHALPDFRPSGIIEASVCKETYIEQSKGSGFDFLFSVWAVDVEYESYSISAYMDTEKFTLYDISVISYVEDFSYEYEGNSPENYLEYLAMFSPVPDLQGQNEIYYVNDLYSERSIELYLCKINMNTNHFTTYRFNR